MKRRDRFLRKLVPSVPVLSHRLFMRVLDWLDAVISLPFEEARQLPPNRYRIRVGVGNRMLFNQFAYKYQSVNFWFYVFQSGMATTHSRIVDLGSGCGRYAILLRDYHACGEAFLRSYTGIEVDREMVDWCQAHFPTGQFHFHHADVYNEVYNPSGRLTGTEYRFPLRTESQEFVFANSLFTHLLEDELQHYLRESFRIMIHKGWMQATVFCVDMMHGTLGGRWTFSHRKGHAFIENPRLPEAAVAYTRDFLLQSCTDAGFGEVRIIPGEEQSVIQCQK